MEPAPLLSLPVELQRLIVDFVEPGDILCLYSCCKQFQVLSGARLEDHRRLSRIRRGWIYGDGPTVNLNASNIFGSSFLHNWIIISQVFLDIKENPWFAWYIQDLTWYHGDRAKTVEMPKDLDLVHDLIDNFPSLNDAERGHMMRAVDEAKGGVLFALLLAQLPWLRRLTIEDSDEDPICPYTALVISRLAQRSHYGYLGQPLSTLETISIEWTRETQDGTLDPKQILRLLVALAALPNLKHLRLHKYFSDAAIDQETGDSLDWKSDLDNLDPPFPLFYGPSHLRSLEVVRGRLSASVLSRVLNNCVTLENFKYQIKDDGEVFGWSEVDETPHPDFSLSSILTALQNFASSSLRYLHLYIITWLRIDSPPMDWNLHKFTSLERLTLDIGLFDPRDGQSLTLEDVLPTSLRELCFLSGLFPPDSSSFKAYNIIRNFHPQLFPHLHTIAIWDDNQALISPYQDIGPIVSSHIIPIYKSTLIDRGIPPSDIREYRIDADFFLDRRGLRGYPRPSSHDGQIDWEIHALPTEDTAGHLIVGMYHSEENEVQKGENYFDGLRVRKTW